MSNDYSAMINAAAQAYGADSGVLSGIARRESNYNPGAVNNWDSNAAAGNRSQGMFQFVRPTYDAFSRQAMAANPRAWAGVNNTWMDPHAQALTTAWAITHGHGGDWATFKAAQGDAGKHGPALGAVVSPSPASSPTQSTGDSTLASILTQSGVNPIVAQMLAADEAGSGTTQGSNSAPVMTTSPGKGGRTLGAIEALGRQFGLAMPTLGQSTGGQHAAGSYHYQGRAVDFGDANNSRANLDRMAAYARANPGQFKELFFNPLGWGIKNGQIVRGLTVAGHDNHMHVAM